jgi:hypothetical protein
MQYLISLLLTPLVVDIDVLKNASDRLGQGALEMSGPKELGNCCSNSKRPQSSVDNGRVPGDYNIG